VDAKEGVPGIHSLNRYGKLLKLFSHFADDAKQIVGREGKEASSSEHSLGVSNCSLEFNLNNKKDEEWTMERRRAIRNLKKNSIIYGRMVQRWFLLHLSVGCHIFFFFISFF
jgi:hypothetical protein